ncbi:MAG: hypothetical protein QM767_28895 [Anaeromyxobacter sp.]
MAINVTRYSENRVTWEADITQARPLVILAGWLKGTLTPDATVMAALSSAKITTGDYSSILGADPYADDQRGTQSPDPARFEFITLLAYEATGNTYFFETDNSYSSSSSATATYAYSTGFTQSVSIPIVGSLKSKDSFSFTSRSTRSNSVSASSINTITVASPGAHFTRGPYLYLFIDKTYHTFFFSFVR